MNAKKRARACALAVVMLLGLVPSCRDEPRPALSPPPAVVPAPDPAQAARTIPTRPLPEAWTAGKGFPADFRLEVSTSWEGNRRTTVLEAGGDATGTIVMNDIENNGERWDCRYTIAQADLAKFRWSELMAFMEQRRREGIVVPTLPPVTDLPSKSISLRAFGVVADLEIFREYDAIDEVNLHVSAVTKGAWQWYAIRDQHANLKGALEQCYGGTLPQRDDVEGMRRLNARMQAPPLEAQIAIDAGQGRARALRIKGAEALKEERRCMEDAIDRVRLPIPTQPTCNPIWTLLLRPSPSSWLPIRHRTE